MPFIEHKHGKTFYNTKGCCKGNNKPIIWLHGGPGSSHDPKSPLFELAKSRKVVLYDQIGGGKSSALTKAKMKIETFVRDLDILISELGLNEFHLAGGSWGTTLALEYFLRKKGKGVYSLIFQSPMFSAKRWESDAQKLIEKLPKQDQKVIRYCHEIKATDAKVYKEAMFKFYLKHVLRNEEKLKEMMSRNNPNGKEVYEYMWGASEFKPTGTLKTYNRVPQLSKIDVPTLFLCGQYDEATPEATKDFAKKVKDSKVKIIKSASHVILKEKPDKILKEISNFLEAVER